MLFGARKQIEVLTAELQRAQQSEAAAQAELAALQERMNALDAQPAGEHLRLKFFTGLAKHEYLWRLGQAGAKLFGHTGQRLASRNSIGCPGEQ